MVNTMCVNRHMERMIRCRGTSSKTDWSRQMQALDPARFYQALGPMQFAPPHTHNAAYTASDNASRLQSLNNVLRCLAHQPRPISTASGRLGAAVSLAAFNVVAALAFLHRRIQLLQRWISWCKISLRNLPELIPPASSVGEIRCHG